MVSNLVVSATVCVFVFAVFCILANCIRVIRRAMPGKGLTATARLPILFIGTEPVSIAARLLYNLLVVFQTTAMPRPDEISANGEPTHSFKVRRRALGESFAAVFNTLQSEKVHFRSRGVRWLLLAEQLYAIASRRWEETKLAPSRWRAIWLHLPLDTEYRDTFFIEVMTCFFALVAQCGIREYLHEDATPGILEPLRVTNGVVSTHADDVDKLNSVACVHFARHVPSTLFPGILTLRFLVWWYIGGKWANRPKSDHDLTPDLSDKLKVPLASVRAMFDESRVSKLENVASKLNNPAKEFLFYVLAAKLSKQVTAYGTTEEYRQSSPTAIYWFMRYRIRLLWSVALCSGMAILLVFALELTHDTIVFMLT
jgi:hypothetical protein